MNNQALKRIENKLDLLLNSKRYRINEKKYITAREVEDLTGLNHRIILNRLNLNEEIQRYIPSIQLGGSRRKYFERKVITMKSEITMRYHFHILPILSHSFPILPNPSQGFSGLPNPSHTIDGITGFEVC